MFASFEKLFSGVNTGLDGFATAADIIDQLLTSYDEDILDIRYALIDELEIDWPSSDEEGSEIGTPKHPPSIPIGDSKKADPSYVRKKTSCFFLSLFYTNTFLCCISLLGIT